MNLLQKIAHNKNIKKPVIYGIESFELNDKEKYFFANSGPVGFIIFSRNIKDKDQLLKLTNSLKELMQSDVLILIDQEGGRVSRLSPPIWPKYPSGQYFGDIYATDKDQAKSAIYDNFQKISDDLIQLGINVNCAPILDIITPITHKVIGDRAYGDNSDQIIDLAKQICKSLLSKNIYPVIKHIPGHGRALCDSHFELPEITNDYNTLKYSDFLPFKALNQQKFAMTAHILYTKIDSNFCATHSSKMIDIIRNEINFKNILMTDDISMKALKGEIGDSAIKALNAGCDLILHCNSNMTEMQQIDKALPLINDNLRIKFN